MTWDVSVELEESGQAVHYTVGNDMRVTVKTSLWVAISLVIAGEVPYDERLVS